MCFVRLINFTQSIDYKDKADSMETTFYIVLNIKKEKGFETGRKIALTIIPASINTRQFVQHL